MSRIISNLVICLALVCSCAAIAGNNGNGGSTKPVAIEGDDCGSPKHVAIEGDDCGSFKP